MQKIINKIFLFSFIIMSCFVLTREDKVQAKEIGYDLNPISLLANKSSSYLAVNDGCHLEDANSCQTYELTEVQYYDPTPELSSLEKRTMHFELGRRGTNNEKYLIVSFVKTFPAGALTQVAYEGNFNVTFNGYYISFRIEEDVIDSLFLSDDGYVSEIKIIDTNDYGGVITVGHQFEYAIIPVDYDPDAPVEEPSTPGSPGGSWEDPGLIEEMVFCDQDNVKNAFHIVGYLLFVAKVAVPLLLIVLGAIDFSKAIISDDDKSVKESAMMFAKRIIIAAIIFLIPTVLNFLFSLVDGAKDLSGKFTGCTNCLFKPLDGDGCQYKTLREQAND